MFRLKTTKKIYKVNTKKVPDFESKCALLNINFYIRFYTTFTHVFTYFDSKSGTFFVSTLYIPKAGSLVFSAKLKNFANLEWVVWGGYGFGIWIGM